MSRVVVTKDGTIRLLAISLTLVPPLLLLFWLRWHLVNLPYWDEWDETPIFVAFHHGTLTLADLWAPHSVHRVFTMRLTVLAIDALQHGWNTVSESFVGVCTAILTLCGLVVLSYRTLPERTALFILPLISLSIFSVSQYENWTWGFQVAWFYVDAALVWAIVLLGDPKGRVISFIGAAVLCVFATASLATGLLAWFACGAVIALTNMPRRWTRLVAWGALATLMIGFYFTNLPSQDFHPHHDVAYVTSALAYAVNYLVIPVVGEIGMPGIAIAGWLFAPALVLLCFVALRGPARTSAIPWIGLIIFAVGDAGLTGLGRSVEAVGSSRYITVSQCAWIGVIALVALLLPALTPRMRATTAAAGLCVFVSFIAFNNFMYPNMVYTAWRAANARAAILGGNASDDVLKTVYPSPELQRTYLAQLRSVGERPRR